MTHPPSEPPLRVLVVDDDEAMRQSVRRILRMDGYQVDLASNGQELFAHQRLDDCFAILLDRKLPDVDANQLIGRLREQSPHSVILIVTGHADLNSTIDAIRQGVDDYLIKPLEPETLRSRLNSLAELYRVRRELRKSESRMRVLVEHLPAGAVYVDHGKLFTNRAVEAFTGYQSDEIGTVEDWFRVLCGEREAECRKHYQQVRNEGFTSTCLLPVRRKDGVCRTLEIAGYRYDHHEIWLVIDATELHDAQRQVVQSERLAAIGQMVTGLAHESRNALQRARGCLDLLELDLEGQREQLDLTSRIRRSLNDLQRNYEEVRQYAAPITIERSEINLVDLIEGVFDDLRVDFGGLDHRICFHCDPNITVQADDHRLHQAFRNILDNAIAASVGAAQISVSAQTVPVEQDNKRWLEITIADCGKGMDAETLARIFEPFHTTKQSGTGLGMAICKRIVDAHNGRIRAESEPGQGAKITLALPID
ncbi:MAG: ATP-binding protein [Pirellulales bacterium]|nr:ATP-binding protein [Pirellulales bacterium]